MPTEIQRTVPHSTDQILLKMQCSLYYCQKILNSIYKYHSFSDRNMQSSFDFVPGCHDIIENNV